MTPMTEAEAQIRGPVGEVWRTKRGDDLCAIVVEGDRVYVLRWLRLAETWCYMATSDRNAVVDAWALHLHGGRCPHPDDAIMQHTSLPGHVVCRQCGESMLMPVPLVLPRGAVVIERMRPKRLARKQEVTDGDG